MEKFYEFLRSIFSIFLLMAIGGGAVVFLIFIFALIVGGQVGEILATSANKVIMTYSIKSAAIAMFAGLLSFYVSNSHQLLLDEEQAKS